MIYRTLGRTGFEVSAVSFGAWAIGGFWGAVDDETSMAALHAWSTSRPMVTTQESAAPRNHAAKSMS